MSVAVRVPATTANLGPGFDALGAALSLHLHAGVTERGADRVVTLGEGAGEVAADEGNLVWSSLVRFCREHGADVPDVSLRVRNEVPLERGLGSSSAAIVAGLALGRALTGVSLGDLDLVRLAAEIEGHPDNVAPAILGGVVACAAADDGTLVIRRAQPPAAARPIVAIPAARQSTTAARGVLPAALPRAEVAAQAARAALTTGAFVGAWPFAAEVAGDLLHEPARLEVMAATGTVVRGWRAAGLAAWLSGAGPTAAGVLRHGDDRAAALAVAEAADFDVRILDWDLAGVLACAGNGCAFSGVKGCASCPRTRL